MPEDQPESDTEYDENWERTARLRHRNEFGASAVEYGMLTAGISAVISAAVWGLGQRVGPLYELINWPGWGS